MRGAEQAVAGMYRFDVRGRLGDGGGGVVYRAFDRTRGHEVALKLMHPREERELTRFRASFDALARLVHPNLVQLYELVEERQRVLLVMELIEGGDLLSYVRREAKGFDELRLRAAFGQLAQGLSAMHGARKVHRDVKPANVRVTSQGRVVVLDLDLALDLDGERGDWALGEAPSPVGTALYMAPEQAASLRLGPACDWYSMGVVLYEALTGVRPYDGSDLEILLAKQAGAPRPPEELSPGLPPDLAQLCVDLLQPDPAQRPTGAEVLRRLGVHEDVLSARWTSASLLSARSPFVGRGAELAAILQAVERSRAETVVLRVSGPPGAGKTSLCEEALRRVTQADARVLALSSACPRYPERPHAPLHEPIARMAEALREGRPSVRLAVSASALRLLERAFPGAVIGIEAKGQGRTAPAPEPLEQRWRAIAALRALLADLAASRPLVLWLDDYHWADVDTQRFVSSLVSGPGGPRMLLMLSEEPQPGLSSSSLPTAHEVVALGALSAEEASALTGELLARVGEVRPGLVHALSSHHERWPFYLRERVRHALLSGDAPGAGASFTSQLAGRIAELSEPARRVLELVCTAFDAIPQAVCEQAAELLPAEFMRHVTSLSIAGLVRCTLLGSEDALAPSHPLIAEHVDLALQGPRRVTVHERLASALVARDAERVSGRLLRHQGESGDHARAAESAALAAEEACAALAFQRSAELFTLSASLRPPGQDERGHTLLRRMADALANAGWVLSAATVYREAAQCASAAEALHMRQRSLECLLRGAEVEDGERMVRELVGSLGVPLSTTSQGARWAIYRHRMQLKLFGVGFRELHESRIAPSALRRIDVLFASAAQLSRVDLVLGAELLLRALVAAREVGEPRRMARALCMEAWNFVGRRGLDRARSASLIASARTLTARHDAPLLDGHVRLAQGMVALSGFQMHDCSLHCRDAERVFRDSCSDADWELSMAQFHQHFALSLMAQYRELGPKLARLLSEAEERGDMWTYSVLLGVRALGVSLAEDAPEQAEALVREASSRWSALERLHVQAMVNFMARGSIDLYRGVDHPDERLEQRFAELEAGELMRVPVLRIGLSELRARARVMAASQRQDAGKLRTIEAEARRLTGEREPAPTGFGLLLLANVYFLRAERARAQRALEQAIQALDPLGLAQWVLPARMALGRLIGGERGRALTESAQAQLKQRGVQRSERFAAMMLPAFARA